MASKQQAAPVTDPQAEYNNVVARIDAVRAELARLQTELAGIPDKIKECARTGDIATMFDVQQRGDRLPFFIRQTQIKLHELQIESLTARLPLVRIEVDAAYSIMIEAESEYLAAKAKYEQANGNLAELQYEPRIIGTDIGVHRRSILALQHESEAATRGQVVRSLWTGG